MNVIKIGIHNISDTDFKASLPKVSEAVKYSLTGPEVITTGIITPRNINKDFQEVQLTYQLLLVLCLG